MLDNINNFFFPFHLKRLEDKPHFSDEKNSLGLRVGAPLRKIDITASKGKQKLKKVGPCMKEFSFKFPICIFLFTITVQFFFITATSAKFSCQKEKRKFNKHKNTDSPETLSEPHQINTTSVLSLNSYYFHFSCKLHRD